MTIDLIFPAHPPALDGIGDYTARLAETLADRHAVRFLTAQEPAEPIPGVTSEQAFACSPRRRILDVVDAVAARKPDAVVLQYNPFSYGQWGLNLHLPLAFHRIQQRCPDATLALMVHEPFVPVENVRFAVMTVWQRLQLWLLGHTADLMAFSITPWADRFQQWFPATRVMHLPVGSNMPKVNTSRRDAREALSLDPDGFVIGVFGSAHASRLLPFVRRAAAAVRVRRRDAQVLYIGPDGPAVAQALDGAAPMTDAGALPPVAVSRHLTACDLYLAPFRKGVSTRRGSFMAGLQHGLPTISTHGAQTDPMLGRAHGRCFLLAPDDDSQTFARQAVRLASSETERHRLAGAGTAFFQTHFAWERIADRLTESLTSTLQRPAISTA